MKNLINAIQSAVVYLDSHKNNNKLFDGRQPQYSPHKRVRLPHI
jgi:hypothetical protein